MNYADFTTHKRGNGPIATKQVECRHCGWRGVKHPEYSNAAIELMAEERKGHVCPKSDEEMVMASKRDFCPKCGGLSFDGMNIGECIAYLGRVWHDECLPDELFYDDHDRAMEDSTTSHGQD